jgi:hypothetical protein
VVHEFGAVIDDLRAHAWRQGFLDLLQFALQRSGDVVRVLAHQHEPESQHGLAAALIGHGPAPNLGADLDVRHIPHVDRDAVLGGDHDLSDLLEVCDSADPLDQQHLPAGSDASAPSQHVVGLHGLDDLVEGQSMLDQPGGINADLVLLLEAAPAVDFRDARDRTQGGLDHPVLDRAHLCDVRAVRSNDVMEYLAETGRDGSHFGQRDAGRKPHGAEPFADEATCEVNIRAIQKGHDDLGESELRDGPDLDQVRQTADRLLDRKSDLLLDLLRAERRGDGVDLDLDRSRVRKGVHVERTKRHESGEQARGQQRQNEQPMLQRPSDDPVEHGLFLTRSPRSSPHPACSSGSRT